MGVPRCYEYVYIKAKYVYIYVYVKIWECLDGSGPMRMGRCKLYNMYLHIYTSIYLCICKYIHLYMCIYIYFNIYIFFSHIFSENCRNMINNEKTK